MDSELLSVGIDVGTSTTSVIFSSLLVRNTASGFTVPALSIIDKKIVYRGGIHVTPLLDESHIDAGRVREIVAGEYAEAGITPAEVSTGAVIITGESARKENAAALAASLGEFCGDFVVATAGPDLESIIAAKGAGAQQLSQQRGCTAVNLDIGGGTSNLAAFCCGELCAKGCYDVGGRLVRTDEAGAITYVSERLRPLLEELGFSLPLGAPAGEEGLRALTDRMASLLGEALGLLPATDRLPPLQTAGSSAFSLKQKIDALSFSGGVADYIYHPAKDWRRYGDIGLLLADSIRESGWFRCCNVVPPLETIRATVVGAGSYTTTLSGSTIFYSGEGLFPLKNVPVLALDPGTERSCLAGECGALREQARWFLQQSDADNLFFCLRQTQNPSYREVGALAGALAGAAEELPPGQPLLVLTRYDFSKSLGLALWRLLKGQRPVVSIDSVQAGEGDYLDIGKPLMDGMAVPVVCKTLIYG